MTALELLENQACEVIAEAEAQRHSPARDVHETGALKAAEAIVAAIQQRQERTLAVLRADDETAEQDLRNAMQVLVGAIDVWDELWHWLDDRADGAPDAPTWCKDAGRFAAQLDSQALEAVRDRIALALAKLKLEGKAAV